MVNLADPTGTTSLRVFPLAPLPCPRKGVGLRTVPELSMDAMVESLDIVNVLFLLLTKF